MPLPRRALLVFGLSLATIGCGDILDVEDPDVTSDDFFTDLSSVPALRAAAINDFGNGYEALILYGGLMADEWVHSGTFPTRQEVDRRSVTTDNATLFSVFASIARAGATADFVNQRFEVADTAGGATFQRGEVRALGGLALVAIAENYCSGVPISRLDRSTGSDVFNFGGAITTQALLDSAVVRFQSALTVVQGQASSGNVNSQRLARVGLARALLNQGNYEAAAAAVGGTAGVPTGFVYRIDHSENSGGENNPMWAVNINTERWSATNNEGGNGLSYLAARDPRMLWIRSPSNDVGFDRRTPQFDALKYPSRPAFTPVATGVEARLIEAEAALQSGDTDTFLARLNDLRSSAGALMPLLSFDYATQVLRANFPTTASMLPELTLPATRDAQVDLLFRERAYWMWLTGHRLGDMRRLIRQYGRSADSVFPVGVYAPNGNNKGGIYGNDVNLPIPVQEAANPTEGAGQCLDRNP